MASKTIIIAGACAAALLAAPAFGQTNVVPKHRPHHHHIVAAKMSVAETRETRDLNRQQLAVGQTQMQAQMQSQPGLQQTALQNTGNAAAHRPDVASEPVSRAMFQRVPGGNPLYSAAAGGGGRVEGPPPAHN